MRITELNKPSLKDLENRVSKASATQKARSAAKKPVAPQPAPRVEPVAPVVKPIDKLIADGLPDAWLLDDGTAVVMPNFVHDDKARRRWIQKQLDNDHIPLYRKR